MMVPSGVWSVVSAVVLGILLLAKLLASRKYKNLPPGPRGLPIIGSLHLLGKFPQRDLAKLAETYGPLMSLWLGSRLVVVATSPAAAEEILKAQGSNFGNRIATSFSNVVVPGDIAFTSDSPVRLHLKKVLHLQFSTNKQMRELRERMDAFMSPIIFEHVVQRKSGSICVKDMVDVLLDQIEDETLQFDITTDNAKSTLWDAFIASMSSTIDTIEWAIVECIHNPIVMKKIQEELDNVVGKSRRVEDADVPNLKYLQAIIKENFCLHPVGPLLFPHLSEEPCKVWGYHIPKETPLIVNVGAIARDPRTCLDPMTFNPERFLDGMPNAHIQVEGQNFELLPFGAGRRQCPGIMLASTLVYIIVATFMQSFDWSLPNGLQPMDLDMSKDEGIALVLAHPLIAIPKARLSIP